MHIKVELTNAMDAQVRERAQASGRPVSQLVSEAIRFYLAADADGVVRVGRYWAVPEDKLALRYALPVVE